MVTNGRAFQEKTLIKREIFQGDTLSPLLALIPLSTELKKSVRGNQTSKLPAKLPDLLYMDNLKFYGKKTLSEMESSSTLSEYTAKILQRNLD